MRVSHPQNFLEPFFEILPLTVLLYLIVPSSEDQHLLKMQNFLMIYSSEVPIFMTSAIFKKPISIIVRFSPKLNMMIAAILHLRISHQGLILRRSYSRVQSYSNIVYSKGLQDSLILHMMILLILILLFFTGTLAFPNRHSKVIQILDNQCSGIIQILEILVSRKRILGQPLKETPILASPNSMMPSLKAAVFKRA